MSAPRPFSIGVAMIVRDEERCLGRSLAPLRELRRAGVLDQLLVLDTGSVDATVALAEQYGATVRTTTWTDDFGAARSTAMALCETDWVLMLDADEALDGDLAETAETLRRLQWTSPDFVGEIEVVSTIEARIAAGDGSHRTTTSGWIPRLLPAGTLWCGRVHEQPVWDGPCRRTTIRASHDGYAPEVIAAKRGRNAALLRAEVAEHPGDAHLLLQYGRALEADRDFAEAAAVYQQALALTPTSEPARHDLVVRMLFTLGQAGRTADAVALAEAESRRWADSPDFHFCLGDLLLDHGLAHPEATAEVLPLIEGSWLRCLELGERPELVGAVAGRGSHLAAYNLAVLYEAMGQQTKAAEYQQRFRDLQSSDRA
ncbi:glycosyltransferase [Nocardioides sp.]|uniref:glycosyltransferase n=1 Tax=Nocardioides sp. TaxID=35761 RepID=UPI0026329A60|nr:glycosyltransferase [Nocardioides sp.]